MKTKTGRKEWERITINVTPELAAKIKRAAESDDRSVSRFAGRSPLQLPETRHDGDPLAFVNGTTSNGSAPIFAITCQRLPNRLPNQGNFGKAWQPIGNFLPRAVVAQLDRAAVF